MLQVQRQRKVLNDVFGQLNFLYFVLVGQIYLRRIICVNHLFAILFLQIDRNITKYRLDIETATRLSRSWNNVVIAKFIIFTFYPIFECR